MKLEFVRSGHSPVRATTDARGQYEVRLEPGRYAIEAPELEIATLHPAAVVVEHDAHVDLGIDTGVR